MTENEARNLKETLDEALKPFKEAVDKRFDGVDKRLDGADKRFQNVYDLITQSYTSLDEKIENFRNEMRDEIQDLKGRLGIVSRRLDNLTEEFIDFKLEMRKTNDKFKAERKALGSRIKKLEKEVETIQNKQGANGAKNQLKVLEKKVLALEKKVAKLTLQKAS